MTFIRNLLSKMVIVGIYYVVNGIPIILCFISVMWNICLKGLFKNLFCSIDWVGTMYSFLN